MLAEHLMMREYGEVSAVPEGRGKGDQRGTGSGVVCPGRHQVHSS